MSSSEVIIFCGFITLMGSFYYWFLGSEDREVRRRAQDDRSRVIPVAGCGSLFVPQLDKLVGSRSVLYIPSGDGLYPTRRKRARNRTYQDGLAQWLARGAVIHLIVTIPNDEVATVWHPLKALYPDRLHVHLLDRSRAAGPSAAQTRAKIEQLDTFHAAILLNPPGTASAPGALWIEANHPVGAKHAYHIEFVAPKDAALDTRLVAYHSLYEELLEGPHTSELGEPSAAPAVISRERIAA